MKMQKKLDSYFKLIPKYDETQKKCFIYDPQNCKAFFTSKPELTDKYVTLKSGIKLFYRCSHKENSINIPTIICKYDIPLVKSNLQKAIRRCDSQIAIQSALVLIQCAPMELLRRLPIIYIEDVCLMDSYPIVVWLMMADRDYIINNDDIDKLLNIIHSLCVCKKYFPYVANDYNYAFTHESLQFCPNSNELLSLYYRSLYGGLKGDIQMLKVCIDYYRLHPTEIVKTEYHNINYDLIEREIEILVEAIDFHCYPQMLNMLCKSTCLNKDVIKQHIWFVESGYNYRKPETQESSKLYEANVEWKKIEKYLDETRYLLIK
jgi:hypothetical protein